MKLDFEGTSDIELKQLIANLQGHGGYNPFWPCQFCKMKDEARAELERREKGGA